MRDPLRKVFQRTLGRFKHGAAPSEAAVDVLRQELPLRLAALTDRRRPDAVARHEELLRRSASYASAVRSAEQLPGIKGESVTIAGLSFFVPADSRKPGSLSDRVLRRQWLPLKELLRSRDFATGTGMIDVGANIGTTSIPRAVLGDFQYIYAAEPAPANFTALVTNVLANRLCGIVLPDRVAIGSTNSRATLQLAKKIGSHRLVTGLPSMLDKRERHRDIDVESVRLDEWVERLAIDLDRIACIKCDTQGWEGHVLRGARNVLRRRHITWQLEISPQMLIDSGIEVAEVLEILSMSFSHFLNLRDQLVGPRIQPTTNLRRAVTEFVSKSERKGFTDLVFYNSG